MKTLALSPRVATDLCTVYTSFNEDPGTITQGGHRPVYCIYTLQWGPWYYQGGTDLCTAVYIIHPSMRNAQPVRDTRARFISRAACKYELRRKRRANSWGVFIIFHKIPSIMRCTCIWYQLYAMFYYMRVLETRRVVVANSRDFRRLAVWLQTTGQSAGRSQ